MSDALSTAVSKLPRLRVEDMQAMSEEEWEAFFDAAVESETTYLFEENGEPIGVVMVPMTVLARMVQAAGKSEPDAAADTQVP